MANKIVKQIEPNYMRSMNGGSEYTEVIFGLSNGQLYKGTRDTNESPVANRQKFRKWLAATKTGNYAELSEYEFEEVDRIEWSFIAKSEVSFNSKGQIE